MISEEMIRHFLTHVAQGVQYTDQQHMWCGCLDLYSGDRKPVFTGGMM